MSNVVINGVPKDIEKEVEDIKYFVHPSILKPTLFLFTLIYSMIPGLLLAGHINSLWNKLRR